MDLPTDPHPLAVVVHAASGQLAIEWSDGLHRLLSAQHLRQACKCAECEHRRRTGKPVEAVEGLRFSAVTPYGEGALRLAFDDGHDRGLYPWPYLHALASQINPSDTP